MPSATAAAEQPSRRGSAVTINAVVRHSGLEAGTQRHGTQADAFQAQRPPRTVDSFQLPSPEPMPTSDTTATPTLPVTVNSPDSAIAEPRQMLRDMFRERAPRRGHARPSISVC